MNRNTGLTALLTIEIVTVLVAGIWVNTRDLNDYKEFRHQIVTLQERLTVMKKRIAKAEESLDECQQDLVDQGGMIRRMLMKEKVQP
jgi:hypothetical protein